jgi:CRP/FNR family cyclic AMP-dependent transcriptional regulator
VTSVSRYRELLKAGRWFRGLTEDFQERILANAAFVTLASGTRLFSRGDPPSGLYAVLDGAVRITTSAERGREMLVMLAEPPTWFGELSLFDRKPHTHDATADQDSAVLHLRTDTMGPILEEQPRYWRDLALLVACKLRTALLSMEVMAFMPPIARLARLLCLMAEGYGDWFERSLRQLEVRQDQLASMLAVSRQTVNQMLRELEARGAIRLAYGRVEILDMPALRLAASQPH